MVIQRSSMDLWWSSVCSLHHGDSAFIHELIWWSSVCPWHYGDSAFSHGLLVILCLSMASYWFVIQCLFMDLWWFNVYPWTQGDPAVIHDNWRFNWTGIISVINICIVIMIIELISSRTLILCLKTVIFWFKYFSETQASIEPTNNKPCFYRIDH